MAESNQPNPKTTDGPCKQDDMPAEVIGEQASPPPGGKKQKPKSDGQVLAELGDKIGGPA